MQSPMSIVVLNALMPSNQTISSHGIFLKTRIFEYLGEVLLVLLNNPAAI